MRVWGRSGVAAAAPPWRGGAPGWGRRAEATSSPESGAAGSCAGRGGSPGGDLNLGGTERDGTGGCQPGRGCVTRDRQDASRRRAGGSSAGPACSGPARGGGEASWSPAHPQPQPWHLRAASGSAAGQGLQSIPAGTGEATGCRGGKKGERSRSERGWKVRVVPSKGEKEGEFSARC